MARMIGALLAMAFILYCSFPVKAGERVVQGDYGGIIEEKLAEVQQVARLGHRVIIDGECYSACVMWFHKDAGTTFCATRNARIGFHIPYYEFPGTNILIQVELYVQAARKAGDYLIDGMPPGYQSFLRANYHRIPSPHDGSARDDMLIIQGEQAERMIGKC